MLPAGLLLIVNGQIRDVVIPVTSLVTILGYEVNSLVYILQLVAPWRVHVSHLHVQIVGYLGAYRTVDEDIQVEVLVAEGVVPSEGPLREWRTDVGLINDPNDNDAFSDRYIEDGSYLRLKSMALGYTFDQKLIQKIGLTNLRLTLTASNLFTITGYSGYDPEVGLSTQSANVYGLDFGRYPSPTTVTFGLNLSF